LGRPFGSDVVVATGELEAAEFDAVDAIDDVGGVSSGF
jgi:hypothetical protein